MVRVARVPAGARLEPVCNGGSGQGGETHLAPLETARYQGALYQGLDCTVLEAVEKVQARIEELREAQGDRHQLELKFDGLGQPITAVAWWPTRVGLPPFSVLSAAVGQQNIFDSVVSY